MSCARVNSLGNLPMLRDRNDLFFWGHIILHVCKHGIGSWVRMIWQGSIDMVLLFEGCLPFRAEVEGKAEQQCLKTGHLSWHWGS